jgi:hypothetical protein
VDSKLRTCIKVLVLNRHLGFCREKEKVSKSNHEVKSKLNAQAIEDIARLIQASVNPLRLIQVSEALKGTNSTARWDYQIMFDASMAILW